MTRLVRSLFSIYLFLLPVTHWLAPSGWLPLPNIIILLISLLLPLTPEARIRLHWRDLIIYALATLACISTLANPDFVTQRSINHLAAILFVTLASYTIGGRVLFSFLRDTWKTPLLLGFVFSCFLCIFEFVLVNRFGQPLPGYRPFTQEYDSTFLFGVRPRSTFSESGHFAFYLAVIAPILLAAFRKTASAVLVRFLLLTCAVLLFSTSLFIVFLAWALASIFLYRIYRRPSGVLIIGVLTLTLSSIAPLIFALSDTVILSKFSSFSFDDRLEKFSAIVNLVVMGDPLHAMLGYGMGSFESLGMENSINCYANFVRDIGFFGLTLFALAIVPFESQSKHLTPAWRHAFLYSGIAAAIYFLAIPDYYFPHFAFLLGLMSTAARDQRVCEPISFEKREQPA